MLKDIPTSTFWYSLLGLAYLIVGGTYPAQAVLFSRLIHVFTLRGLEAKQQADFYALMFFVLALGNLLGFFCVGLATNSIGQTLTHHYRGEMIERILRFDQEFFHHPENSFGALTVRLSSVPSPVQESMSANVGLIVNVVVNILACSVLAIAFGWKLGLTMVSAGLSLIVAGGYNRIRLDPKLEASTEKSFRAARALLQKPSLRSRLSVR